MLSNNQSKFIKSLQLKKYRKLHSCFFVEGKVNVLEAIDSNLKIKTLFITQEFEKLLKIELNNDIEVVLVTSKELEKVGTFQSNNFGLAVIEFPEVKSEEINGNWSIALDRINDPGNLGTILRTADWFGITDVYCSQDSVDVYNPKVLNSTKGSFARVNVHYLDLNFFLKDKYVVSAEMEGDNLYSFDWGKNGGVLLMGNESHGVSDKLSSLCTNKITIPRYGKAESLNVAIATSVICSDIMSKQ